MSAAPSVSPRSPIIFQPPYPLVWTPELWIITRGPNDEDADWGGADVSWSEEEGAADDPMIARIGPHIVMGELLRTLEAGPDGAGTHLELIDRGTLTTAAPAAAARGQTLAYLGDGRGDFELIAYTGMRLVGFGSAPESHVYQIDGLLRRGVYGTTPRMHPPGTRFAALTADVGRLPLPHRLLAVGARLWLRIRDLEPCPEEDAELEAVEPIIVDLDPSCLPWGQEEGRVWGTPPTATV